MKKMIINVLFVVLLLGHCVGRYVEKLPTKKQAIDQYKQYNELENLKQYANEQETRAILRRQDSLRRIKNPYKYIK